ncbi:uncharacterized protein [Cardiocondyla obscurior]|uniref:uncharacterized protein n=1 Tax=Cardiocondyla obscurior TaxID=286306 RepID=UPI0039657C66
MSHDESPNTSSSHNSTVDLVSERNSQITDELDNLIGSCQHFDGGSEFDEPLRLRRIKEKFPESYKQLASRVQELVDPWFSAVNRQKWGPTKNTLAQCYDSNLIATVKECWTTCVNSSSITLVNYSSIPTKETTSTLSMIAPLATDSADAESSNLPTSDQILHDLFGESGSSTNSTRSTGKTFSYISACQNGRALRKFGLEEDYKDVRIMIKLYDGNVCKENPQKFWLGKTKELDVTVNKNSQLNQTIEAVFQRVALSLKGKEKARLWDQDEMERKQGSKKFPRKFTPY